MRSGMVGIQEVIEEGYRLTGAFHITEDRLAVATLRKWTGEKSRVGELVTGRGIFRGQIFSRMFVDDPSLGEPYVSAKDIVNADVCPAGYLSRRHGELLDQLRLHEGMILITCSGMNLGRAIWARRDFEGLIASHDLIRIEPDDKAVAPGYLYAFLASRYGHAVIRKQIYGGSIKHIEPEHIAGLSVPRLGKKLERQAHDLVQRSASLRVQASQLLRDVAARFDTLLAGIDLSTQRKTPRIAAVNSSSIQGRLDAQFHDPLVRAVRERLAGRQHTTISEWCNRIFLPGIFKRIHVEDVAYGAPYYTGATLFWLEPQPKGVLARKTTLFEQVRMDEGTVLVQAFGQEGGLTGRAVWVGRHLAGSTTTHMLVRLRAETREDTAYLFGFLQSDAAYRQIASLTYGGSIPHFDEAGIATVVLPLLSPKDRQEIAQQVLTAVSNRDDALDAERGARALIEDAIETGATN